MASVLLATLLWIITFVLAARILNPVAEDDHPAIKSSPAPAVPLENIIALSPAFVSGLYAPAPIDPAAYLIHPPLLARYIPPFESVEVTFSLVFILVVPIPILPDPSIVILAEPAELKAIAAASVALNKNVPVPL